MKALFLLALAALAMVGCSGESGPELITLAVRRADDTTARLRVEVAVTPDELEQGLSERKSLPEGRGMLFVIERRGPGFWMKDVPFPLSIAFVSECGVIVDIQDMEPYSLTLHDTRHDFRFGLEVGRGWFAENTVRPGDVLELPPSLRRPSCGGS